MKYFCLYDPHSLLMETGFFRILGQSHRKVPFYSKFTFAFVNSKYIIHSSNSWSFSAAKVNCLSSFSLLSRCQLVMKWNTTQLRSGKRGFYLFQANISFPWHPEPWSGKQPLGEWWLRGNPWQWETQVHFSNTWTP